ncbi:hypothetical protein TNCV_387591 [Trichonephila clavipes]|nr:hypothetical protein TNCV_387591 [Trichonephila clavipes]
MTISINVLNNIPSGQVYRQVETIPKLEKVTKAYFQRKVRNGSRNFNFNKINDNIKQLELVQSEAVYKFFLPLDIKVQWATAQEKKVWIPKHKHQKLERKNRAPVVRCESTGPGSSI